MDNWQTVLRRQYLRRDPELNPLGPEPLDPANKVSREPTETREVKDEDAEGMDVDTTVSSLFRMQVATKRDNRVE